VSSHPLIVAFCCQCCGYTAADVAGAMRIQYAPSVRILRVPCSGKVEPEHVLSVLERGVDGVVIVGCPRGHCHFVDGNLRASKRVERLQQLLEEMGLERERLAMVEIASGDGAGFAALVDRLTDQLTRLGPSPLASKPVTRTARPRQGDAE
jgi:F420-non-reducing hydrogenase iron-sulfur subunit